MPIIESSQLPNGIQVLSEAIPDAHGIGLSVLIDAGPQDEPNNLAGLAHLCEHVFFLGTRSKTEEEIAGLIDSAGGQLGGFTARDYTCLHATISADYVTYAIDLLGEMIAGPRFSAERLANESNVIGHEINASEDDASIWLDGELKREMWKGDPLGRSILGTQETVRRCTKADVQDFLVRNYTPDRVVIAAAGRVDHDDFVEQLNDSFWMLKGHDTRRNKKPAEPVGGVVVAPREQRTTVASVMLPTPVYHHPDRYALHVLTTLLGGGISSRLFRDVREKHGFAYDIGACLNAYGRGGVLAIEATSDPQHVMQCLVHTFDHLVRLVEDPDGIDEEEFWKAKMHLRGQAFLSSDSIPTRVSRLATQQFYFGKPLLIDDLMNEIDAVDLKAVRRVASQVISRGLENCSLGVAGAIQGDRQALYADLAGMKDCFSSVNS